MSKSKKKKEKVPPPRTKRENLMEKFKALESLDTPDIFQQIKMADIARKLGINIAVSETVSNALNFKHPKKHHGAKKKNKRHISRNGKVKTLKYGSSLPTKYKDYIVSRFWEDRKREFFEKVEKKCAACSSVEDICLHHMYYGVLGKEKDEHLIPLCNGCHEEYHSINGVKKDMIKETLQFVESKQFSLIVDWIE